VKSDLVDISCTIVRETEKAVLIDDGTQQAWLPKSQVEIQYDGPMLDGTPALVVTMPKRLAKEKELI
jgi:RNase P/RNase MRP subunit p29